MSFTAFLRPPLVWLVTAEVVLIAIMGSVAWHVWQEHAPAAQVSAGVPPSPAPSPRPASRPVSRPRAQPSSSPAPGATPLARPTPGIRTDPDFVSRQLVELNRVETTFADLEWRVTRAVVDAIQHYLEGVVLPSIERSERGQR
ncbi:MAG TPA: hypothetical protein VGO86_03880 [Candidatus Dormibacteraeota bacterium]|jgi:hypothetical protein